MSGNLCSHCIQMSLRFLQWWGLIELHSTIVLRMRWNPKCRLDYVWVFYCVVRRIVLWEQVFQYDEICSWFAEEFRYVLGKDWKEKLRIPTKFLPMSCIYGKQYPWSMPSAHIMWVYHLLLAKQGKIDHGVPGFGYPIGGINDKDTSIKFAECIEWQLLNAGVRGVRLALELDYICSTKRRTSSDLCGGSIKIESLCHHPTHRLWEDYIQK